VYSTDAKLWGCDAVELLMYLSDATMKSFAQRTLPQTQTAPEACDLERLLDQVAIISERLLPDGRDLESVKLSCRAFHDLLGAAFNPSHMWKYEQRVASHAKDLYELVADQDEDTLREVIELMDRKRKSRPVEDTAAASEILIRPKRARQFQSLNHAIFVQAIACTADHYSTLASTPP
jgi:hypothetical protein